MTTREPDPTPGTEGDKLIGDGDDFAFGPSATSPVLDRILSRVITPISCGAWLVTRSSQSVCSVPPPEPSPFDLKVIHPFSL